MKLDLRALNTLVLLAALAGTVAASPASATIISVTSSATVLDVALSVLTIPIAVGPLYLAAGAAPPPAYSSANGFASYSISSGPFSLTTGLLSDTASGNLATGGTASSSLASFDLSVASGPITYLAFAASAVSSTTSVHDSATSAGVNWSSTLADATLTVLGLSITIGTNPPTNDVIYNAGGLNITLNPGDSRPTRNLWRNYRRPRAQFHRIPSGVRYKPKSSERLHRHRPVVRERNSDAVLCHSGDLNLGDDATRVRWPRLRRLS
jgi:hypothetical protein